MNDVQLDTEELDKIAKGLKKNRRKILEAFAFEVEREAKINAPVLTGTLRTSIHTVTEGGSTATSKEGQEDLPAPRGDIVAVVGSGVEYAAFVELGTSNMAAQPYLGPAVEHKAQKLNSGDMWKELFE
jgi:HK97 gp10 family phage protein